MREAQDKEESQKIAEEPVKGAKNILKDSKKFLSELFNLRHDTDRDSTIAAVKNDISFKGHNAWILIFSIFIASIGLNVSSTAVVIGAMLISPLMGPIVGVGLSLAINDVETLRKSLKNLFVMVLLSVLTAYIYFTISPIKELTPELEGRTYPTILDVLVAIFGGLALIVAKTKKGTIASVIFGVAIATALMPPLCTVGYGLAVGNPGFYLGALYLFSINAVFIALSTFVVSKLLGFPMVRYANSKRRRFIAQMASLVAIIVLVPSVILFYNLIQRQIFDNDIKDFVESTITYKGAEIIKFSQDYKTKAIDIYLIGSLVPQERIQEWLKALKENERLNDVNLEVHQGSDRSGEMATQMSNQVKSDILQDLYFNNQEALVDKNEKIQLLEEELLRLKTNDLPFDNLSEEVAINYENIEQFGYASVLEKNFKNQATDTMPTFFISWTPSISQENKDIETEKLSKWLKLKFKLDTLSIKAYN
ncbi:MAG: DUF389 domain-containing protein [Leeuwenhoekiella sp.]